jgi:HPt (histidine-containing phosphotransfer) domain-containing protein
VQVHALKGAAGSIGAEGIGKEAGELEEAGRRGDEEAVKAGLPGFCRRLGELVERIGRELEGRLEGMGNGGAGGHERERHGEGGVSADFYPTLKSLKAALEGKRMKEIDRLLDEIDRIQADREKREAVNTLSDQILMGEYQRAIETINALLTPKEG